MQTSVQTMCLIVISETMVHDLATTQIGSDLQRLAAAEICDRAKVCSFQPALQMPPLGLLAPKHNRGAHFLGP